MQINEKDRYKKMFNVPFGQYEWNIISFGLKNTPFEFQQIMNDIFNLYVNFIINYIVYSNSIKQHFKHLAQFHKIAKNNGLVLSKRKMNLV